MKNFRLMNKNKIYLLIILLLLLIIGTGYASLYSSLGMQGSIKVAKDRTLYNVLARSATLDTNVSFSSTNVANGIYEVSSTKSDTNPVYYYRGSVTNNNVKFANFCWKIVRTTSTGGVKLIYNGVPSSTGSCNNTGTASQIGTSKFNDLHTSVAYSGYMYGDVYESKKENMAIVISSHNLAELESFCNKVTIIKNGKVVETSTINEVKKVEQSYIIELNNLENVEQILEKSIEQVNETRFKINISRDEIPRNC